MHGTSPREVAFTADVGRRWCAPGARTVNTSASWRVQRMVLGFSIAVVWLECMFRCSRNAGSSSRVGAVGVAALMVADVSYTIPYIILYYNVYVYIFLYR